MGALEAGNGAIWMTSPGERPKILIVITLAEIGGAQTCVAALLPALAESFDVTVAAHGPGPLRDAAAAAGVNYVPLRFVRRSLGLHDVLGLLELVLLIRRLRPDVVHTHSSKAGILGRLAAAVCRVPVVLFTAHGWAFKATAGVAALLYRIADRIAARVSTAVVCVSETELREGLAAGTCRADRTTVIYNGVDVDAVEPRGHAAAERPSVVSVGRLKAPKDFGTLVDALALLPAGSFRANLIGDGPDRVEIERRIDELGLRDAVRIAGERDGVVEDLRAADCFALSSKSEGLPVSVLEAMAAGLPVVASDVGGVGELVVDGETGFLVPPGDPDALARRLEELLQDEALRERQGAAGRARAREHFSLQRFRNAHLHLYGSLLDGTESG